jgi:hypothetical protein
VRYENLLTRSFQIVRRKPWLVILALVAGETSNSGGGGDGGGYQVQTPTSAPDLAWLPQWLADRVSLFIEIAAVLLVLALVWFVVSCIGSGALLGAAARIDAGEPITFGASWRLGVAAFRRVLAFKLLLAAGFLLPALLLLVPPLVGTVGGTRGLLTGLLLDLPLLIAYAYWASFLNWVSQLAIRACVLDGLGAWSAFVAAWALLRRRFSRVALTTVIFVGVGIGVGILTAVVFAVLEVPLLASLLALAGQARWSDLAGMLLLWALILIPVSLAISSTVGAYFATAWTLAYRRFDVEAEAPEPPPLAA